MKVLCQRPPEPNDPGYILQGDFSNGALTLETILPGCRNPAPHVVLNVLLPPQRTPSSRAAPRGVPRRRGAMVRLPVLHRRIILRLARQPQIIPVLSADTGASTKRVREAINEMVEWGLCADVGVVRNGGRNVILWSLNHNNG